MVSLILDTNIWIAFVAKDKPFGLLEKLIEKKNKKEIILLSNEVIVQEWFRNKKKTIKAIKNSINGSLNTAKNFADFLDNNDKVNYLNNLKYYFNQERQRTEIAIKRVEQTEKLLLECEMTPITNEMKIKVTDWALNKRAPFVKKSNSVGDALILLSSIEYWKTKTVGFDDSIFVSYNHEDYSDGKNIDFIHGDLHELISNANMRFTRHIGEALNLAPKLTKEIDDYIEYRLESWIEMQAEIAKGK